MGRAKAKYSFSETELVIHLSKDCLLASIHLLCTPDFLPSEMSPKSDFKALILPTVSPVAPLCLLLSCISIHNTRLLSAAKGVF